MANIGIWDAPPLEKTPEELEKERRYREAVQFGADYDRDPNRMLQKLQQQRRSRDVMGQIDPLTQEIIREQEDKSSGAYLNRPYTPGQRVPVPDNSPPPEVGPAAPPRVNGPRSLRAIMPPGEEPPMARANIPGVKFQTNAPLNDEGVAALDQDVMARQMAQAEQSNAMRAKVAEALANRQAQPRTPTLHRVRYMAARGLNPDKTPMEQPISVPGNEVGANMLSSILKARMGGGRPDPWSDQATQNRIAVKNAEGATRREVQELRNEGGLAVQGARNEGGAATQKLRNAGAFDVANIRSETARAVAKMNFDSDVAVQNAKNALAAAHDKAVDARATSRDKEDYREALLAAKARAEVARSSKDKEPGYWKGTPKGRLDLDDFIAKLDSSLLEQGQP